MPSCAVVTCRVRSGDKNTSIQNISFHRFPSKPSLKEQWIDATGRDDWMPTKTSTICSKHFTEKDYVKKKSGRKYLNPGAIPQDKVVRIIRVPDIKESLEAEAQKHNIGSNSDEAGHQKVQENLPCSNESTPRIRKLKEIIAMKDAIIKRQRTQIKRIQAQNRRLKRRLNKKEDVLNEVQKFVCAVRQNTEEYQHTG